MANRLRPLLWALLLQGSAAVGASAAAPSVTIPPGYLRVEVPSGLTATEYAKAGRSMMLVAAFRPKTTPPDGVILVDRRTGRVVGRFTQAQLLGVRSLRSQLPVSEPVREATAGDRDPSQ